MDVYSRYGCSAKKWINSLEVGAGKHCGEGTAEPGFKEFIAQ